jgi:hypothetical protein
MKLVVKSSLWIIAICSFLLLFTTDVKADLPNNTFAADDIIDVHVFCTLLNNSICNNETTTCEISAFYPNTSWLVQNQSMSGNVSGFYNYSFGTLDVEGTYSALVYCQDTTEGVVSFDFIVGDPDQTYENEFWLYVLMILIPLMLFIIGKGMKDKTFILMAGFTICVFALHIYNNGLPRIDNTFITNVFSIVMAGLGFYLIGRTSVEIVKEGL